jgi:broad specificity phosphatase PhoE
MAKDAAIRLLLVRTGPTCWDGGGRLQGSCDLPLSEAGKAEVESFVRTLGKVTLSNVVSAPDEASVETAKVVAAAGRRIPGKVHALPELADPHVGLWEGLREEDLEDRYPRAWGQFTDDVQSVTPPEGETIDSLQARLLPALGRVISKARAGARICIVLRPFALGVLRCRLKGLPMAEAWKYSGPSSAPEWYEVDKNDPRLRPAEPAPAASAA